MVVLNRFSLRFRYNKLKSELTKYYAGRSRLDLYPIRIFSPILISLFDEVSEDKFNISRISLQSAFTVALFKGYAIESFWLVKFIISQLLKTDV